jgi:hypothetical protein
MELNPNAWLKRKKQSLSLRAAHHLLAMSANNDPDSLGWCSPPAGRSLWGFRR